MLLVETYNNQNLKRIIVCQKPPLKGSVRKDVLKNFEKFTEKQVCWSLFLRKMQTFRSVM